MRIVPDDHYRLVSVRLGPIADARDLLAPLDGLLAALARRDSNVFHFSGLTPAYETRPVKDGADDNLPRFIGAAECDYPFGRGADEPTHGVRFFNTCEATDEFADLSLSWFESAVGTPNFVTTLRLGSRAAQPGTGTRGQHLTELLGLLVRAFQPRFGFIELPRPHAPAPPRPSAPVFRWATYFSHPYFEAWRPTPETLPPTAALSTIDGHGITLLATPSLDAEVSSDVARDVEALERVVRPHLLPDEPVATSTPTTSVSAQTAVPSYLRPKPSDASTPQGGGGGEGGRPFAATTPFEEATTEAPRPDRDLSPALPFRRRSTDPAAQESSERGDSAADAGRPLAPPMPFAEATTELLDPRRRVAPAHPFQDAATEAPSPSREPVTPFEQPPPKKKP